MEHFTSPDKFPADAEIDKVISVDVIDVGRVLIEVHKTSPFNIKGIVPGTDTTVELWPNAGQGTKVTICPAATS